MSKAVIVPDEIIQSKIYQVRGFKVMLDRDLAELYQVETKRIKEQVRRNKERFPSHFMFELTQEENQILRSQNASLKHGEHSKYLPYVFTEHGVLMLSNVLKSSRATEISIKIIDVFMKLREMLISNKDLLLKLEQIDKKLINLGYDVKMHDGEIETIFELINEIREEKQKPSLPKNPIGFKTKSQK